MTLALSVTFILMFILTATALGKTIKYRKRIPCMTGMMIAMSLGMMVGLTTGVILGILLAGNLFYSTILGMIVGVSVGFLLGLPVSLMAVLDGALSGMMGGMMGAMLGEMIAPDYQDSIIRIMFLLFVGLSFILFQMMNQELLNKKKSLVTHPTIIICLFILFVSGYNLLGPLIPSSTSQSSDSHSQHQINNKVLAIQADEFSFSPNELEFTAGEKITIVLENIGNVEHDLEITGLNVEQVESSSSHNHHKPSIIHVHAEPGEKQRISFVPLTSGVFKYTCTIPGHAESGMVGTLEISS